MKLFELENEIRCYKRIVNTECLNTKSYVIKSLIDNAPLVRCDFMSMQMKDFIPTMEELFSDDWGVLL